MRSTGKALLTRRPRPKPPRMQPNQRSRKPRSRRSRPPRRSFPGRLSSPTPQPLQPATEAPAVAAIDSRATPNTTAEHPAAETPQPRPRRRSPRPRRTSRKPRPRPPSKSPCPTRKPPLHRPRRRPLPQPVPSPSRVRPLPHSQPRNPKLPSHRPRNPRRAPESRSRARSLSVSPAAPRRRTAWRTPSAVRTAPSPPCPASRSADLACHPSWQKRSGTLTVCHDSPFRSRSFARHHRHLRPAGAAQQHRSRPPRRPARLHALLGGRAPQHAEHRELGARHHDRADRGGDRAPARRLRRRDAAEPRAAAGGRALQGAGRHCSPAASISVSAARRAPTR